MNNNINLSNTADIKLMPAGQLRLSTEGLLISSNKGTFKIVQLKLGGELMNLSKLTSFSTSELQTIQRAIEEVISYLELSFARLQDNSPISLKIKTDLSKREVKAIVQDQIQTIKDMNVSALQDVKNIFHKYAKTSVAQEDDQANPNALGRACQKIFEASIPGKTPIDPHGSIDKINTALNFNLNEVLSTETSFVKSLKNGLEIYRQISTSDLNGPFVSLMISKIENVLCHATAFEKSLQRFITDQTLLSTDKALILAQLYNSPEFNDYTKSICELIQTYKIKQLSIYNVLEKVQSNPFAQHDPLAHAFQRLPRHQMLLADMYKKLCQLEKLSALNQNDLDTFHANMIKCKTLIEEVNSFENEMTVREKFQLLISTFKFKMPSAIHKDKDLKKKWYESFKNLTKDVQVGLKADLEEYKNSRIEESTKASRSIRTQQIVRLRSYLLPAHAKECKQLFGRRFVNQLDRAIQSTPTEIGNLVKLYATENCEEQRAAILEQVKCSLEVEIKHSRLSFFNFFRPRRRQQARKSLLLIIQELKNPEMALIIQKYQSLNNVFQILNFKK